MIFGRIQRVVLTAPEGKRYKKGNVFAVEIFLGLDENPSEWELVDESEIQEVEDESI